MSVYYEWFNRLLDEYEEQLLIEFRQKSPREQLKSIAQAAILFKDYTEFAATHDQEINGMISAFADHVGLEREAFRIEDDVRLTGVLALLIKAQRDVYATKDLGSQKPTNVNDEVDEAPSVGERQAGGDL